MIKILLFEDEPSAVNRLKRLLKKVRPNYQILGDADTIEDGINLLEQEKPDLVISDIQLSDGLSFEIFKKLNSNVPVIFVTAYDKYAIEAFEFNGVYYVLKPITEESINTALQKFETNPHYLAASQKVVDLIKQGEFDTHKRIISKVGDKTKIIPIPTIAIVYSENKMNKVLTFDGTSHLVDYTLDELMERMSGNQFFKISRQFIVNRQAIQHWKPYSSGRLLLKTNPELATDLIVSKDKTPRFKTWMLP